ncbi:hypothetical protein NDU88_011044 [Pleurodeles waltl]|uniref:Uncharacterized protein n=1 Tax=Pleurodeles waltl TaxID=8319 RepID=A0AAV7S4Z8_PLEWA|nr:hypothetical protein NDU88_011044 [Pleurodeles waltl]
MRFQKAFPINLGLQPEGRILRGSLPPPLNILHLWDTDSDRDDVLHDTLNDDFDDGPPEKRRKISPHEYSPHLVPEDLVDPDGDSLFEPTSIHHPNSSEWFPSDHVSDYVSFYLRHPLDKLSRNKVKSECPRPSLPCKVTDTPAIDPNMLLFFTKFGKDPKKGVDRAWSNCQDRLLDLVGPVTRIFDLAEEAKIEGSQVDLDTLSYWAQRVIYMLGNANSYISQERRKSLLLRIDPKFSSLASKEEGLNADGLLFGDSFIKEMSKYVSTFNSLDKVHSSMKIIFSNRVFGRAGKGRSRFAGRFSTRVWCCDRAFPAQSAPSDVSDGADTSFPRLPVVGETRRERGWTNAVARETVMVSRHGNSEKGDAPQPERDPAWETESRRPEETTSEQEHQSGKLTKTEERGKPEDPEEIERKAPGRREQQEDRYNASHDPGGSWLTKVQSLWTQKKDTTKKGTGEGV